MKSFFKDLLAKLRGLVCGASDINDIFRLLEKVMGAVEDLNTKIDGLETFVDEVDKAVEDLYERVKVFTNDGMTPEVAANLNARLDTLREKIAKIQTDDEDAEEPPA